MAVIIDGKALAKKIREQLKEECSKLKKEGILPKLAVIMVGDDPASKVYVRNKSKACNEVGIEYEEYILNSNITQEKLINLIESLNNKKDVHGILLQSPIPKNLDINEAFQAISYKTIVLPDPVGPITAQSSSFSSILNICLWVACSESVKR